jgi:hypothetical protein
MNDYETLKICGRVGDWKFWIHQALMTSSSLGLLILAMPTFSCNFGLINHFYVQAIFLRLCLDEVIKY